VQLHGPRGARTRIIQGMKTRRLLLIGALCALVWTAPARAADPVVRVAVAANFATPLKLLMRRFEQESGYQALLSVGATAKLYAQIQSGAPFDVLLAADTDTPVRLEQEHAAVPGSRFTYATGRLILWSAQGNTVDAHGDVLKNGDFKHLAIAAPQLAPYGAAALQTLTRLGHLERLRPRLVMGESIGQTYSFVASGNAELGFVALSQVYENGQLTGGSGWIVPTHLHSPLRQEAVLLARAKNNPAAIALLAFLKSDSSRTVIRSFGYETP
jgi:molybdate transport system substrate-binding protein